MAEVTGNFSPTSWANVDPVGRQQPGPLTQGLSGLASGIQMGTQLRKAKDEKQIQQLAKNAMEQYRTNDMQGYTASIQGINAINPEVAGKIHNMMGAIDKTNGTMGAMALMGAAYSDDEAVQDKLIQQSQESFNLNSDHPFSIGFEEIKSTPFGENRNQKILQGLKLLERFGYLPEGNGEGNLQERKFKWDKVKESRNNYLEQGKQFRSLEESWGRIKRIGYKRTGASDAALIYNWLHINDPRSTVRESEFRTIQDIRAWISKMRMQGKEYLVPSDLITWMQKATPGENGAFLIPEQREDLMRRAEDMFYGHQEAYDDMTERTIAQAEQDNISGPEIMGEGPYRQYLERRSKKKEFEHETRFQAPTQQDLEDEKQQAINAKEEEISSWEARQAENAFKRTEAGKVKQFVENTGIPTRYVGFNRKLKRWEYFDPQENKRVPVPIEFDEELLNSWLKKFNISDSDLTFDEEKGQIGYYDKKAKKYHVPPFKAKYTPRLFQVWLNKYGITEDDIQYSVKDSAFGWLDEKTGKFHKVPFKLD